MTSLCENNIRTKRIYKKFEDISVGNIYCYTCDRFSTIGSVLQIVQTPPDKYLIIEPYAIDITNNNITITCGSYNYRQIDWDFDISKYAQYLKVVKKIEKL